MDAPCARAFQIFRFFSSLLELVLAEERVISGVIAAMEANRIGLLSLKKHEPTLEDVFVKLVGRSMEEVELVHDPANP